MTIHRYFRATALALLVAVGGGTAVAQQIRLHAPKHAPIADVVLGRVIVKLRGAAMREPRTPALFGAAAARYGISAVKPWLPPALLHFGSPMLKQSTTVDPVVEGSVPSLERIMMVEYSSLDAPQEVADQLALLGSVEYAEPVVTRRLCALPDDPHLPQQWYLDASRIKQAWDITRADSSILVAITDTGIERTHEDLKDAIWYNEKEMGDGPDGDRRQDGKDNDGDGYIDDWWGYDVSGSAGTNPDNDPSATGDEHGVEVAGVVGATGNNARGVAGVAYGVKLMAVKVTDDRHAPDTRVFNGAEGVLFAANHKARIINCSWGGTTPSRAEREAFIHVVRDIGAIVVAAAGNDNQDVAFYPASYPGVLSIASITEGNAKADFSNFNYRVDLSAPGTDIFTTASAGGYRYDSGTSFSAPIVSGIAALVCMRYPAMKADQVAELLRATADDIHTDLGGYASRMGSGRINARLALETGISIAAARMIDYTVTESTPDGGIDPNESVSITMDVKNLLGDAADVHVVMTCISDPNITVQDNVIDLGPMTTEAMKQTPSYAFHFQAPSTLAPNTPIVLKVIVATPDHGDAQYIVLNGAPTYLTTDYNNLACTFNSSGNLGHDGLDQKKGDGLTYRSSGDLLFHGGLMVGVDETHVSDAVRVGRLSEGTTGAFTTIRPYRLTISPDATVQTGRSQFNDAQFDPNRRVGVDVSMTTSEYRESASSNILIVSYVLRNMTTAPLNGLRCGLYLDFDVSATSYEDRVGYDFPHQLGYQRSTFSDGSPWVGALVVTDHGTSFYGVDNDIDFANEAFTPQRKWGMMTAGIHETQTINDMAMVISTGPLSIPVNGRQEVAFALVVASTFDSLRLAADRAHTVYIPADVAPVPVTTAALQAAVFPNPAMPTTDIVVDLPVDAQQVTLRLSDLTGRVVLTLDEGALDAGRHTIPLTLAALPLGTYLFEIRADGLLGGGTIVRGVR